MDLPQISDLEKSLAFAFGNIESCLRLTKSEAIAIPGDRYDGTGRKITEIIFAYMYHRPAIERKGDSLWSKWESFLTGELYIKQKEDVKGDHYSVCHRLEL